MNESTKPLTLAKDATVPSLITFLTLNQNLYLSFLFFQCYMSSNSYNYGPELGGNITKK